MRSYLINKNLSLYYHLKKTVGRRIAFEVVNTIEKVILIFGRERIPHKSVRIHKKIKQLGLIFSIKKSILIWKLMNFNRLTKYE
jgi:hypothetical protein